MFVSPALIPSSTNRQVDHFHPTPYLSHLPVGIFYSMPLITQRNFFNLKQNNSEGFFSFKKRPNTSLYVEYSRTLTPFFEDFKFAYKSTKFYAK